MTDAQGERQSISDRQYWLTILLKMAEPVLTNLAQRRLKQVMPVEKKEGFLSSVHPTTYLEAFGRLLCGLSPWLEARGLEPSEENLRARYADLARACIAAATDPESPDYMNFDQLYQPLVDTAFLSHALLRAPNELWHKLGERERSLLLRALKASRVIPVPSENNWYLFPAIVESAIYRFTGEWLAERVDPAVQRFRVWYLGDGIYGDGPDFRWDYYNSFVIHPMLLDVLSVFGNQRPEWQEMRRLALRFAQRYAVILERLVSPEGTIPAIGRSITYRFSAFQTLAQLALNHELPEILPPPQVRSAMTAVLHRMMDAPGTFSDQGWLQIGFCGHQPLLAEGYISTGSLYLCAAGFLPLGLPPTDQFWADPPMDWTSRRIWSGQNINADRAVYRKYPVE